MTNPTLKPGTRVRYIGPSQFHPEWLNRTGEVTVIHADARQADVEWDHPTGGSPVGHAIPFFKLEMVMPAIDVTKPLRLMVSGDYRAHATFINLFTNGHILVKADNCTATWMIFTKDGFFVRSTDGSGSGLKLANYPEVKKFGHVTKVGDHVVSLNLTETDGEITAVEWVR